MGWMRRHAPRLVALTMVVMVGASCRDGSPVAPGGPFSAVWVGTIVDSAAGTGNVRLVLEQRGNAVSGTFLTTFGGVVGREGAAAGTASGNNLALFFTPPARLVCGPGVTLSGTISIVLALSGGRLAGTYSGLTCGGAESGTLDLGSQ